MLLAPIIQDRKGEHTKVLENLAAQGFIRARIDGEICDLSDPPTLELQKKHTIEVVVDRIKVREGLELRLAESFETALELTGGTVVVAPMEKTSKLNAMIFPPTLPVRTADTACRSWNHACSHSTIPPALVVRVTGWVLSSFLIRNASLPMQN